MHAFDPRGFVSVSWAFLCIKSQKLQDHSVYSTHVVTYNLSVYFTLSTSPTTLLLYYNEQNMLYLVLWVGGYPLLFIPSVFLFISSKSPEICLFD